MANWRRPEKSGSAQQEIALGRTADFEAESWARDRRALTTDSQRTPLPAHAASRPHSRLAVVVGRRCSAMLADLDSSRRMSLPARAAWPAAGAAGCRRSSLASRSSVVSAAAGRSEDLPCHGRHDGAEFSSKPWALPWRDPWRRLRTSSRRPDCLPTDLVPELELALTCLRLEGDYWTIVPLASSPLKHRWKCSALRRLRLGADAGLARKAGV